MNVIKEENIEKRGVFLKGNKSISKRVYIVVKRFLDIFLSLIGLVLLSPFFLIIAIIIKLDSKGPVFFVHSRIGEKGKPIGIYKFRTMVENAEELVKIFSEEQKKEFEESYKLQDDPRVTRIGKFLRKTSLDELPQILNILKGELSIIGPRPVIEEELEKYEENKEKFLSVKPGLTGYWAANGRSDTSYEERIQMELYYVDHISLKLDIQIFFKTIIVVLKKEGAR